MATTRGKTVVMRYMAQIPAELQTKVLRSAARAAANVVADEARRRANSEEVRDNIVTRAVPGRIAVKVTVRAGWARSLGIWAEYGTAPHFITVDDSQRQGMSANRINKLEKGGTLVINGKPVGKTVHHPGAERHPFLRVSLDLKESEAIAMAQSVINSRVGPAGITGADDAEAEDAA